MSIFSGAFGAGFIGQVGQGIEDRGIRQEKYVDNMLGTAKANAGKYAEANALAEQNVLMMNDMQRDFGITEAEYVALAQTRNVEDIYKIAYETRESLSSIPGANPNSITKDMILKGVDLVNNTNLPEGMTAESALRQIFTGTVSNLNTRPDDRSDRHVNNSFGSALRGILNLDPKSSAREQADAMTVAGYNVSDIENFVQSGGQRGKPMPGVSAEGMFSLPDLQYNPEDFNTTTNNYTRRLSRSIVGVDTDNFANTSADVFNGLSTTKEAATNTFTTAGTGFAKLEASLINRGYADGMGGSNLREMLLSDLSNRIDTLDEVKTFNTLIREDTKVVADYLLDRHRAGGISDDDIDRLLSGVALAEEGEVSIEGLFDGTATTPVDTATTPVEPLSSEVLQLLGNNTDSEEDPEEEPISENDARVEAFREAAKNYTYAEYKAMSNKELREAGLPSQGFAQGVAFGLRTGDPYGYFKDEGATQ